MQRLCHAAKGFFTRGGDHGPNRWGLRIDRLVEHPLLGSPSVRSVLARLLGTKEETLYRGVAPEEAAALRSQGWQYDLADSRNQYKFVTPNVKVASAYAAKIPGGTVLEIRAPKTVPYYKLSRFWNGPGYSKAAAERIILVTGKEQIRLLPAAP